MDLNTFFQISVIVFCVVAAIFMIILSLWTIMFRVQLGRLTKILEDILEIVQNTTTDAKDFTERTIYSLETYKKNIFTFEFIRRIVREIIGLTKNKKGDRDEKGK